MEKNYIAASLWINGMTCVNCENKIERTLKNKKGIANAIVNYGKGTAVVTYDPAVISLSDVKDVIGQLGYEVITQNDKDKNLSKRSGKNSYSQYTGGNFSGTAQSSPNSVQIVGVFVILLALYVIINHFGGFNLLNSFPQAKQGMGYGMLFVIGLLTSTHCVAIRVNNGRKTNRASRLIAVAGM